jgi:hypothetical protein
MATKNTTDLKTASVLAFERKLDPSDAVFSSGLWADRSNAKVWPAVLVREKSVRGTISNRLKTKDIDPAKLDAEIEKPNLQTVDVATLPPEADTLQARFTVRVLSGAGVPSACNSAAYQQKLKTVVERWPSATPATWPTAGFCGATAWAQKWSKCKFAIFKTGKPSTPGRSTPLTSRCATLTPQRPTPTTWPHWPR